MPPAATSAQLLPPLPALLLHRASNSARIPAWPPPLKTVQPWTTPVRRHRHRILGYPVAMFAGVCCPLGPPRRTTSPSAASAGPSRGSLLFQLRPTPGSVAELQLCAERLQHQPQSGEGPSQAVCAMSHASATTRMLLINFSGLLFWLRRRPIWRHRSHDAPSLELQRLRRGLRSSTMVHLSRLLASTKAQVCFISETRNSSITKSSIKNHFNLHDAFVVPSQCQSGGL